MENWAGKMLTQAEEDSKMKAQAMTEDEERKSGCASLLNLNDDHMVDRMVFTNLERLKYVVVGSKKKEMIECFSDDHKCDGWEENNLVVIKVAGVRGYTANILTEGDCTKLCPASEEDCDCIFVNGQKVTMDGCELKHNDRVIFGASNVFLFKHQKCADQASMKDTQACPITYDFAIDEKGECEHLEIPPCDKQAGAPGLEESKDSLSMMAALASKVDDMFLKSQMFHVHPDCTEANWISKDLKRQFNFKETVQHNPKTGKKAIVICVENNEEQRTYSWGVAKFSDRLELMRDHFQQFLETGTIGGSETKEKDPWWDSVEDASNPFPEKKKKNKAISNSQTNSNTKSGTAEVKTVPQGSSACCVTF